MNLARRSPAPPFGESDLEQVEQCLAPLRDALERLERVAMAEQTQERLAAALALPGRTLVPEGAFETPRWEVALARRSGSRSGGVLCDRVPHPNGVTTFLMLDVTRDAGLPALTTSFLHGVFVAAAHPDRAAAGIAAQAASALQARGGSERWAALWIAQADRNGEVTSCSAGFRGALWVPSDGGAIVPLERGGPEAGAPTTPRYEEETFRLLPGDLLVAASEGLLNARNTAGRPFGPERLREVVEESRRLPIERLCEAVCDAAAQHSGQTIPVEDAMVLVLHYRASD